LFIPLGSCTAGANNCDTCSSDNTACETCYPGFTADANGVCQGDLFVYTVLLPHPTITYISVLVHFAIT